MGIQNFKTPGGHTAVMEYREGTSDWNTIAACLVNPLNPGGGDNEYRLPSGLSGWALDVGAHIGGVTVGLLLDNPDLRVVAIEAVPANMQLLTRNCERNGVAGRATLIHGAAWDGMGEIEVEHSYRGSETAEVHAFIGSVSPWIDNAERDYTSVPIIALDDVMALNAGAGFVWAKSDCEGCEHRFFRGDSLARIQYLVGEWHLRDGSPDAFAAQLAPTHEVEWSWGDAAGGPFTAVRR